MQVNLFKGSAVESVPNVIGCNVLSSEKPMIQLIHENTTTGTVHCDLYQSKDYTALTINFSFPQQTGD